MKTPAITKVILDTTKAGKGSNVGSGEIIATFKWEGRTAYLHGSIYESDDVFEDDDGNPAVGVEAFDVKLGYSVEGALAGEDNAAPCWSEVSAKHKGKKLAEWLLFQALDTGLEPVDSSEDDS